MSAATVQRATQGNAASSNHPRDCDTDALTGYARSEQQPGSRFQVALLTGAADKPYALGLASALISQGIFLDFIGSDLVNSPGLHTTPQVTFFNLRGDQRLDASLASKVIRVLAYYARLVHYSATAKPKIFHLLWNNKFELFDRTLLMLYYRLLRKRIVLTAHNVNAGIRDSNDTYLNRLSLKSQYCLAHHIFVHTRKMKTEMTSAFSVRENKITVIPFGINDTVPDSELTSAEARQLLGVRRGDKIMLFFGHIAPYKGLEYLVAAMAEIARKDDDYRLIIAGRPKKCAGYWNRIQKSIASSNARDRIIKSIEYIPDEKVEWYFKAADVLVLPYAHISQSGVLLLAYNFGVPVIAADVGSLKEDIIQGETGFVFRAEDSNDLAKTIETYFDSDLYHGLEKRRKVIRDYARKRYSWSKVAEMTEDVYERLSGDGQWAKER